METREEFGSQATADAYMEKHPNVGIFTIELEVGNQTERAQKLYTMLVSGSGPDVFHCNGIHVHDYATSDLIYPIEEFAEVKAEMQNLEKLLGRCVSGWNFICSSNKSKFCRILLE